MAESGGCGGVMPAARVGDRRVIDGRQKASPASRGRAATRETEEKGRAI